MGIVFCSRFLGTFVWCKNRGISEKSSGFDHGVRPGHLPEHLSASRLCLHWAGGVEGFRSGGFDPILM